MVDWLPPTVHIESAAGQARPAQAAMSRSLAEIVDTHPKESSDLEWFYNQSVPAIHMLWQVTTKFLTRLEVLHSLPTHTADSSLKGPLTMGTRDLLVATSF